MKNINKMNNNLFTLCSMIASWLLVAIDYAIGGIDKPTAINFAVSFGLIFWAMHYAVELVNRLQGKR